MSRAVKVSDEAFQVIERHATKHDVTFSKAASNLLLGAEIKANEVFREIASEVPRLLGKEFPKTGWFKALQEGGGKTDGKWVFLGLIVALALLRLKKAGVFPLEES